MFTHVFNKENTFYLMVTPHDIFLNWKWY